MAEIYRCSSCKNEVLEGSNYCLSCGAELEWPDDEETEDEVYKCSSCKNEVEKGSNYCQYCGVKLEWEDDEPAQEELSTLSEAELVIAYGLDSAIPESGSIKYSVAAGGGGLVGGSIIEGLVRSMAYLDANCSKIGLCHSKNRLYCITPNNQIDVDLKDVSVDYKPEHGSDFGTFIIKIPSKEKTYTYPNIYMPNRFFESIMSAKSGKFDKSIYQEGLKNLPPRLVPNKPEPYEDDEDEWII